MVCLIWLIIFALGYRKHNPAKKVLTWFLLTCSVLYFCHALFFTEGLSHTMNCVWAFCSLSVYPIYYLYIKALTTNVSNNCTQYWVLLPGLVYFVVSLFLPTGMLDIARIILFTIQIIFVCISGAKKLRAFDKLVASCYANIEGRETADVKYLLYAFVATSLLSAISNIAGRSFFAKEDSLLVPVAILFATMLFALSYLGYSRDFSYIELQKETSEDSPEDDVPESGDVIGRKLDSLMREKKLFLEKGLKINDVATQIGSCRTYVSNYINQYKGENFSDYINKLRIEEAKTIMSGGDVKIIVLAEQLGFTNEQSFYRSFKKITGMTPVEWKNKNKI